MFDRLCWQLPALVGNIIQKLSVRTCIAEKQLLLLEHMAIVDDPDGRNLVGQAGIHRGRQSHLSQQIEPSCTTYGALQASMASCWKLGTAN